MDLPVVLRADIFRLVELLLMPVKKKVLAWRGRDRDECPWVGYYKQWKNKFYYQVVEELNEVFN